MARYLVTGAAGFIGSNIVEELVRRGEEVWALDNMATGRIDNLQGMLKQIRFIEGDILDDAALKQATQGVDYILHQAAIPSVPRSMKDPFASHEANATGTLRVLLAAREAGVKRVVFASSSSVYGDSPTLPKREDMPTRPLSPYAVSKLTGEEYCKVFARVFDVPTVALRYFNVFGPRQNPDSQYAAVIPAFIKAISAGKQPTIYGDGTQTRDFSYISNVVAANLLACRSDAAVGLALNIACGERISLLQLVEQINTLTGRSVEPIFSAGRQGDVKDSLADISLAGEKMGYKAEVLFPEGLKYTVSAISEAAGGK
ncbi:MAG: SDR family oxidoreductase [Chloroflexota bacterium]|nr:SDR family oxidoreductase [Chloroflexota bacterium]